MEQWSQAKGCNPELVKWLLEHFYVCEGWSIPRGLIYQFYLEYCNHNRLNPINAATFGKLVRSVFSDLRTRRLGTRGCGRYHYEGIRVRPHSHLYGRYSSLMTNKQFESLDFSSLEGESFFTVNNKCRKAESSCGSTCELTRFTTWEQELEKKYSTQMFSVVADSYYNHCQEILQHIRSNQLDKVKNLLTLFWESFTYDAINTSFPDICQLFCSYDAQLYKIIEEILLRDFRGDFSVQHLQSARYFAKRFKSWLTDALEGTPLLLQSLKMRAANMFVNRLRRRTCICNLAKSMHIVLNNHRMVSTLRSDLRAIISQGLLNIPSKSTRMLNCSLEEIGCSFEWKCFDSLLALLDTAADIRAYFQCVSTLVHLFVFQPSNFRGEEFTQLAANFQLRWNYFLSAISRALTLSNAESFGSWHLVNLLISEYLTHVLQSYMEEEMEKSLPESMDQLSHDAIQEPDLDSVLKKYSVPSESLNVKSEQTGDKDLNLQNITIKPLGFKVDTLTGNKLIQVLVEDEPSKSTLKLNLSLGKKAVVTLKNGQTFEIHTSRMQQHVAGDVQT
ncbi:DNA-binding protein RFX8-like isoform X1 [Scyliorhinus canicula]|uniref:DNA-binding protein RFX8-like isoform X1 n=2 Tax=Scyliorhinus canicula TaxID=7830 RepID=UPI0018F555FC|nr:DNA-binding protein RFX8-like isoform X1 [Scyliorhinus canicula]